MFVWGTLKFEDRENSWIDPIIPNDIVTFGDVCGAFSQLFKEMKKKEIEDY